MRSHITSSLLCLIAVCVVGCANTQNHISHSLKNTGQSMELMGDDIAIKHRINSAISNDPAFQNSHIVVTSFNRNVLLVGQTNNPRLKMRAQNFAARIPQVNRIYNEITVRGVTSALTRSSDTWITTKVKSDLIAKMGPDANRIKVVTENGTVYLLGTLSRAEAKQAANVARRLGGVQRVVQLFEYDN